MKIKVGISRKVSAIVLAAALAVGMLFATAAEAASITLTWTFNYSQDPACSSTLTSNCVTGFEYGTTPDSGKTLVKIGTAPNPATTTGTATSLSALFTQGAPYGAVVYYARTSGLDGNGNVVFSVPALAASAQITPGAPTNITVTVK
ncbi:MAG TPA: hypothetical protein VGD60_02625 [Candidatus Acidoferrales bacterium]